MRKIKRVKPKPENVNQTGFSLVELLITMLVIGVLFGAFLITFTSIQNINKKALDINTANTIAYAKVQEYENKDFTSLPNTTPTGSLVQVEDFSSSLPNSLESPRVATVSVNTMSTTLKQVVVNIQFGGGPSQRTIQYADFIQKNGLGR
jgi:prepilin-type N-terminal cleavage/methylation domain-containing protein